MPRAAPVMTATLACAFIGRYPSYRGDGSASRSGKENGPAERELPGPAKRAPQLRAPPARR
jgi:hypothetical protein